MTVSELIAALNNATPDSNVVINVGGTQVEQFDVDTSGGVVTLQGREESTTA